MDLKPFNTFGVSVQAPNFSIISKQSEIPSLSPQTLFLGEGANVLFTHDFAGSVAKNELKGRKVVSSDEQSVIVEVASGENWHNLVMWSVEQGLSGIENLALIPGTVGGAVVGNIAAYGQTFGEACEFVKGFNLSNLRDLRTLSRSECRFYYRDSIFKHELKDKFFVSSVVIKLSKQAKFDTNYHSRYESLKSELPEPPYSPKQIAEAVIRLRNKKLPDWHKLATAGSFFKNPFVSKEKFADLQKQMPDLQAYPIDHMLYPNPDDPVFKMADKVKIPAGRLLDELGWRGKRIGNVGTFEKHALVVVNYGGATGQEILEFTKMMQEDVKKNFEIELEPEVIII